MSLLQISVFIENKAGSLAEIIHLLAENDINIRGLSLADSTDFGVLRILVSDTDKALELLQNSGFATGRTLVAAVEIPDQPGGLDSVLQLVSAHNINVEYMYACSRIRSNNAIMIFRFDKSEDAIELLHKHGFRLITSSELKNSFPENRQCS